MENHENKKLSFIESLLNAMGITDEEERKRRIKEHEEEIRKLQEKMEERFQFLRPFIKKLQIFTENDIYQYMKKEKEKPDWVNFKSVKMLLHQLYMDKELNFHVIYQEDPRPNTFIYYIPEISEENKQFYINCIEECNKLKTDCHERLFQKNR